MLFRSRVDIPLKARAAPVYVHDVRVPGMLHGRVLRPPYPGRDGGSFVGTSLIAVDRDSIAHHLEESGEPIALTEALLSTEYDAGGLPRRIGVELWAEPESPPMRLAADRQGDVEVIGDSVRRELARMSFRLEGASGTGAYELLKRA